MVQSIMLLLLSSIIFCLLLIFFFEYPVELIAASAENSLESCSVLFVFALQQP